MRGVDVEGPESGVANKDEESESSSGDGDQGSKLYETGLTPDRR